MSHLLHLSLVLPQFDGVQLQLSSAIVPALHLRHSVFRRVLLTQGLLAPRAAGTAASRARCRAFTLGGVVCDGHKLRFDLVQLVVQGLC